MHGRGIVRLAGTAAVALGVSVVLTLPAQAAGTASQHGTCSATSTTKLSAAVKNDTIRVKAKVATDVAGEAWSYSIADNGTTVVSDVATTGDDGKFKVKQAIPNLEGTDTVDFTATDSVTGETCTAEAVLEG